MPYEVTVFPQVEPVTLDEVKRQSRLYSDVTDEDEVVLLYLRASREMIEKEIGQVCVQQTLRAFFDGFPRGCDDRPRELELPIGPAASVSLVEYRDSTGAWVELDGAFWELAGARQPGRVVLTPGSSWPADVYGTRAESVRVTYVAGRSEVALVPHTIRQAILLQAAFFYDHRVPVADRKSFVLARSVNALIGLERVWRL